MKGIVQRGASPTKNSGAFTSIELALVIVVLAMLVGMHHPFYSRMRERTYVTIDQNNVRQILQASAIYARENDERLAHPTWGGDLTGPDGWAYLTSKAGRTVPGSTQNTPGSSAGRDVNSPQFTNQLAFFKVGQVAQHLPGVKTAWCPKDVVKRHAGQPRSLWLARPVKVTSYTWTSAIGGYAGSNASLPSGRTYKISEFLPSDWQIWEADESNPFNFNDAADHAAAPSERPSPRHTGLQNWWRIGVSARNLPGGAIVGKFGGGAELVRWQKVYDLFNQKVPAPNDLLNGPGYQ